MQTLHIFDMDGTIVDSSHRYNTIVENGIKKIDLPYWIANEHKTMEDKPLPLSKLYKKLISSPEDIVCIATARIGCNLTKLWLYLNDMIPNHFIARTGRDDIRGGAELKIEGINKLLTDDITKIVVYEDNWKYLNDIADYYTTLGYDVEKRFIPSTQGY